MGQGGSLFLSEAHYQICQAQRTGTTQWDTWHSQHILRGREEKRREEKAVDRATGTRRFGFSPGPCKCVSRWLQQSTSSFCGSVHAFVKWGAQQLLHGNVLPQMGRERAKRWSALRKDKLSAGSALLQDQKFPPFPCQVRIKQSTMSIIVDHHLTPNESKISQ